MKLLIVLRTCSKKSVNMNPQERIVTGTREELILKCADSLIKSANYYKGDTEIKILDDHSDEEFLSELSLIAAASIHQISIRNLEVAGFNFSAHEQFKEALSTDGLVYFVEDDYFHTEDAISAMIDFMQNNIVSNYRRFAPLAIYPYDCPHRYWPKLVEPALIFNDGSRYWRTVMHTANTILIHSNVVKNFWQIFESLALNYPNIKENNSINLLWSNLIDHGGPVACFSPIPSVAVHVSYLNEPPNKLTNEMTNFNYEWENYEWIVKT